MNIFELMHEKYVLPRKPKLFESFAGLGCQRLAFNRLGLDYESVGISEIDKYAIQSYMAIHGDTKNFGSICDIKGQDLPQIDVFTWSFPCFTKDALVMTNFGFKKIVDVVNGDMVMTHDRTFKRVIRTLDNGIKQTLEIKGMSVDEIVCTPNHKFYTRELKRVYYHNPNTQSRRFEDPKWVEAKDLNKNTYLGVAINQNSIIPTLPKEIEHLSNKKDFWYIIGRYLGDGWLRHQSGIIICCERSETKEISDRLDRLGINYCISKERTVNKIHIPKQVYKEYFTKFGKGASNKRITQDVFDLPTDLLEGFIEGYLESDGSFTQGVYKTSSVSKELSYGFAQCVAKVYKTPYRIYKNTRKNDYLIEGRSGKQLPAYSVVFKKEVKKQDKAFYEDGYIWFPIKSIREHSLENVYDLEVEENHSYTVNGTIVHNCTDLSKAGKQKGLNNTRSGLVYEVLRIMQECKVNGNLPKVLIMENVVDLVQSKFIRQFQEIQLELEQLGFSNYTQTLNAKDYGVAQNRDRVFMVSILGEYYYDFQQPIKLEKRLKDYLEDNVDEKYYLSDKFIEGMLKEDTGGVDRKGKFMRSFQETIEERIASTITTRETNVATSNFIIMPEDTKQGYAKAYEGDGVYINRPHQKRGVVQDGMIQTLKTSCNDVGVVIIDDTYKNREVRLYEDCSPTIRSEREGLKVVVYDDYNQQIRNDQNTIGTLTTNCGSSTERNGFKIIENGLRIRKLTEKECWRLMGIDDGDFNKASKVCSRSQLYKQAGNGIVVDVFASILSTMQGEQNE